MVCATKNVQISSARAIHCVIRTKQTRRKSIRKRGTTSAPLFFQERKLCILCVSADLFFYRHQAIVFCRALTATRCTGLDLPSTHRHGKVCNESIFGLTTAMRNDRCKVVLFCQEDCVYCLRQCSDLI